jgi:hypothetical protein
VLLWRPYAEIQYAVRDALARRDGEAQSKWGPWVDDVKYLK